MKDFIKRNIPDSTYSKLRTVYKNVITHYQRDIYSEFGEDFIAAVILGFKKDGFYVDVGAYRPKELSVTYYFYKKLGWSGVIVEPNPAASKAFTSQRPRDTFVNLGVGGKEEELTYFEFKNATLNSFSREVFERNQKELVAKRQIPVRPLSKILAEHVPAGTTIDLMNIDVEGLDLEALRSNDWDRFSPRVIIIEDHLFRPESPLDSEIVRFLKEKGYQLRANCLISLVFSREGL